MIGTTFADRYEIIGRLGDGGSGNVWKANDTHQNLLVALKTFAPGSPTIHAYTEASILTALEGEHVLRVYNADTYLDIPYIATRIARAGSVEDLREVNPLGLPADLVVTWIRQALVGLGACHDRRLLHRDIKPDNIFLDSIEFALLGDFEKAHPLDAAGFAPAEGSPFTIAPEMWTSGSGSVVSDIYSMGVTAYRVLTGAWPFEAATRAALVPLVVAGRYEDIRDRAPHVSRRLGARIQQAMALDPAHRYQSWREMHEDLGQPGLVRRVWRRQSPHTGHDRCWVETRATHGGLHQICTIVDPLGFVDLDVRTATGAMHRVPNRSKARVPGRQQGVALRDLFDHF